MKVKPVAFAVPDRWTIHGYYTMSPWAPDGSGRLLLAGGNLEQGYGEVLVLHVDGKIADRYGKVKLSPSFYHTGFWQSWGPDGRYLYYQDSTEHDPQIVRIDTNTRETAVINGEMEGIPPFGEPIYSGLHSMLYAAGYGDGIYKPAHAPVPFQSRDKHGLFSYSFNQGYRRLVLSVADILQIHPDKVALQRADEHLKAVYGAHDGLTLMIYCVRWNAQGDRFLFYFGNHCTAQCRPEPRLAYIYTADRSLQEVHLALDLSYDKFGVHWSWHPDGIHLIGYGPDPDKPSSMCIAQTRYDGCGYRKILDHASGGHPSISPTNHNLLVTDTSSQPGHVTFYTLSTRASIMDYELPRVFGDREPPGRNRYRVCHHPVFHPDGKVVLVNALPGLNAHVVQLPAPEG